MHPKLETLEPKWPRGVQGASKRGLLKSSPKQLQDAKILLNLQKIAVFIFLHYHSKLAMFENLQNLGKVASEDTVFEILSKIDNLKIYLKSMGNKSKSDTLKQQAIKRP